VNIIHFVLRGYGVGNAYKRNRETIFYFIYCSKFTLFLLFYYITYTKMIFIKHSLITISILVIAILVMPATSETILQYSQRMCYFIFIYYA